jgi:hypothetical protein
MKKAHATHNHNLKMSKTAEEETQSSLRKTAFLSFPSLESLLFRIQASIRTNETAYDGQSTMWKDHTHNMYEVANQVRLFPCRFTEFSCLFCNHFLFFHPVLGLISFIFAGSLLHGRCRGGGQCLVRRTRSFA